MALQATPSKFIMYIGNSQLIKIIGLQDLITQSYLNAATLTATLIDVNGTQITGCIGIPLVYIIGSNGNYQGIAGDHTFQPPVATGYTLLISGSQGSNNDINLELLVEVRSRQS